MKIIFNMFKIRYRLYKLDMLISTVKHLLFVQKKPAFSWVLDFVHLTLHEKPRKLVPHEN